jgi:transposase
MGRNRQDDRSLCGLALEARHMRVSLSTMRNKTDRNDARGIAQMMRLGWHRAVHVKNIEMQKMRTLLANRKQWRKAGYVLT